MNKSAVLHIPKSQYAFPLSEHRFVVRIRAAKGDLDKCTLLYGDRAYPRTPVEFTRVQMKIGYSTGLFDIFEYVIDDCPSRLCYLFELESGTDKVLYYADRFHRLGGDRELSGGILLEGRSEYYQYPVILRDEIPGEPRWFKDSVVYNIFPDSFADGRRHISENENKRKTYTDERGLCHKSVHGGTIKGITENLDYIKGMGFNCVYLNPIFSAGEYHRYDTLDYYHIDPILGTDNDLAELVDTAHSLDMHVIIDGVFNHCSWYHPFFDDVVKNGSSSKYADWFYEVSYPVERPDTDEQKPTYACFAYERKMPKLNTSNKAVQDYFAGVGSYWVRKYHIDGWRLDVANEIDRNFWRVFRRAVKDADPEAVLIGEIWENAQDWLLGDMVDSTMNYDFRNICRDFFALDLTDEESFSDSVTEMVLRYPSQIVRGQLNLLDSHDVARFLSLCNGDVHKWKCAAAFLYMMPGVPDIFYGDEKNIAGTDENGYRNAMDWDETDDDSEENFIKNLADIRKRYIDPDDRMNIKGDDKNHLVCLKRSGRHTFYGIFCKGTITIGDAVNFAVGTRDTESDRGYSILASDNIFGGMMRENSFVVIEMR